MYAGEWPGDDCNRGDDIISGDWPDITRIVAEWSIITKHKVFVWSQMPTACDGVYWFGNIRFVEEYVVYPDMGTIYCDGISWYSDDPFD